MKIKNKDDENNYDTKSNNKKNNNVISDYKGDNLNEDNNENWGKIIINNKSLILDIY